jgi:signal transduction histidine kinase
MNRPREPDTSRRSRLGARGWIAGAAVVVAVGSAGAAYAAHDVARSDAQRSRRALVANSADVASKVNLAIQREDDLVVSTSAFLVANPHISNGSFNRWLRADRAFARYPEILGVGRLVLVPASQLPAFAARAKRDPTGTLAPDGSFQVYPPGKRPYYCLSDLSGSPPGVPLSPAGVDACATPGASASLFAARDSGLGSYKPFVLGKQTLLAIQTPIYRGGGVPPTVAARRASFTGLAGVILTPAVVLNTALAGHPDTSVTLRYVRGSSAVAFTSGKAPRGAHSLSSNFHNGWTVHTFAAVAAGGMLSNRNALPILIGGIALSLLLGLLVVVLTTGRARAVRQVHEQTVELRDQASELRTIVAELEAAQAIKDEFLALISHELRTPLTSIRGFAELLMTDQLTDEQRSYLDVIDRNSARLVSLVEDLLLMAQIQSGGLPLHVGKVILGDLIARSGEAARPFAASKEIELDIDTEPGVAMDGDVMRLGQVLDNVVSNAIKYTPKGGDVAITMTHTGETATIAVSDTGMGIPEADQAQIFGRFFRTANAVDSGIEGTGLGLAITRGIVEAHGGTIGFESVEGAGTTFRITLPLAGAAELETAA